jgi:hypothetical protein
VTRRLLALNVLLVLASLALAGYIVWELRSPPPDAAGRPRPAAPTTAAPGGPTAPAGPQVTPVPPGAIASRNLFSPTRSEAPPTPAGPGPTAAPPMPKPNLFGVVVRDEASIAYLEDPLTKRVAGYRVGDIIAGGTIQRISADRVVLARPDGQVDVRLHDPSRPRPAVPQGVPPRAATSVPRPQPGVPPRVGVPGVQPPDGQTLPSGRRLPPNLLRRLPPQPGGAPTNAPDR